MRYFLETEFSEAGSTKPIRLISIGIVAEDGREIYLESGEWVMADINPWVRENVLPHLRGVIRWEIRSFRPRNLKSTTP